MRTMAFLNFLVFSYICIGLYLKLRNTNLNLKGTSICDISDNSDCGHIHKWYK